MKVKIALIMMAITAVFHACKSTEPEFWLGADISWATEYEAKG